MIARLQRHQVFEMFFMDRYTRRNVTEKGGYQILTPPPPPWKKALFGKVQIRPCHRKAHFPNIHGLFVSAFYRPVC